MLPCLPYYILHIIANSISGSNSSALMVVSAKWLLNLRYFDLGWTIACV